MNHRRTDDSESRFARYVEGLASVIGHKDREEPLRHYCTGLLMPCERKSVEPMAAITAPHRTAAQHQSLLHFIGEGKWSDEKVLAKVREMVLPQVERHGAIEAWIIDDTGFPKQGRHSVGVVRQYCGQLGKQDNCQVAVSLSLANHHASLPVAYQLYLPQDWADDRERRRKAGVPEELEFKTKPQIALEQLRWAQQAGPPRGVALLDAGYGNNTGWGCHHGTGDAPRGRHLRDHNGVGTRHCAVAGEEAAVGARPAGNTAAPQPQASAALRRSVGVAPTQVSVADHQLARRHRRAPRLALRLPARSSGAPRREAHRTAPGGMAADRVAALGRYAMQLAWKTICYVLVATAVVEFSCLTHKPG